MWETGNARALYSALGHYLPGYPDEIVELARQQVNDGLNHFAVVARADVKSPGGGGSRLAARRGSSALAPRSRWCSNRNRLPALPSSPTRCCTRDFTA